MRGKTKQFLVLGLGRFGSSVARTLFRMGHDVLAVDTDAELVEDVAQEVTQAVQADATEEGVLESLGARNFDVAVVSIGQNVRDSILVALMCKELGIPQVVAKAMDELHAKVLRKVGVDQVIFPERDMGARVAKSLVTPSVMELISLSNDYQLVDVLMPRSWAGKTIIGLDVRNKHGLTILGIHRGQDFIPSPSADTRFQEGDSLLVMGRQQDITALEER